MASRESMIRNINRQIMKHREMFGEGSREYQDLMRNLESEIGRPLHNKTGQPYYSRSEGRQYDPSALQNAADMVKGEGTATSKAQSYIQDLLDQGLEPSQENIKQAASIEDEVSDNFEAVYKYLQETEEDFDNSDVRMEFAGNAGAHASKQDLVNILQKVTAKQGYTTITEVIEKAKTHGDDMRKNIRDAARKTRSSGKLLPSEVKGRLKK